jgi:hypothetical protein
LNGSFIPFLRPDWSAVAGGLGAYWDRRRSGQVCGQRQPLPSPRKPKPRRSGVCGSVTEYD